MASLAGCATVPRVKEFMKTVMIYDQCGQDPIEFIVLEGDYRRLNGVYINASSTGKDGEKLQRELDNLLYTKKGKRHHKPLNQFPVAEVAAGAFVIIAGFLP